MKIAVIGTGASSYGTVLGVKKANAAVEIDFFDTGREFSTPSVLDQDPDKWPDHTFREFAGLGRKGVRKGLLPARSHFGEPIPRHDTGSAYAPYKSENLGGLTRFWSASLFEFRDEDFAEWPISRAELSPYYRHIVEDIGVAGAQDPLSRYFGDGYVNRPPTFAIPTLRTIAQKINEQQDPNALAGVNRLAIETRPEETTACTACGECFTGCYRNSIFCAADALRRLLPGPAFRLTRERALKILEEGSTRTIVTTRARHSGYQKVFVASGCLGTTEIVLRSLGLVNVKRAYQDNPMYLVPIFGFPSIFANAGPRYTAIASHVLAMTPRNDEDFYCHMLLATVPDQLLRA